MGYVVSRGGTFGVERRRYRTEDGRDMVVIQWGPLRWLTPVLADEVQRLASPYESIALREAEAWLAQQETE